MQHETYDAADRLRSAAQGCWNNATAMYRQASAKEDAATRALYVEMAIGWAALATETLRVSDGRERRANCRRRLPRAAGICDPDRDR